MTITQYPYVFPERPAIQMEFDEQFLEAGICGSRLRKRASGP
jgi:hypothetical protein